MKKFCILSVVLVLTLSVFAGCGCRRQEPAGKNPTDMTIAPTIAPTAAPTEMTTVPTENTTHATENVIIPDTTDHAGTEAATDHTTATDHTGATENDNARTRTVR